MISCPYRPRVLRRRACGPWSSLKALNVLSSIVTASRGRRRYDRYPYPFEVMRTAKMKTPNLIISCRTMETQKKRKRPVCDRCERPLATCICSALPSELLKLAKTSCLVLQHPQELQRKNRSLDFVQLCIEKSYLNVLVQRRFDWNALHKQQSNDEDDAEQEHTWWLVFPSPEAIPLSTALQQQQQQQENSKITLIFLDATWKYAKEMHKWNMDRNQYPSNLVHVKLDDDDSSSMMPPPPRFEIRTPPSERHWSTAECIGWVLSKIENRPEIYDTIMRPLDLTVQQWQGFAAEKKKKKEEADAKKEKQVE